MAVDLVRVVVTTKLGEEHHFPDMPPSLLDAALRPGWIENGKLVLVNVSGSVLVVDARIIKSIGYDGKVLWHCPA
jgi:hypothetical protein